METKICTKCGEEKQLEEFTKSARIKSGYLSICKCCRRNYINEYNKRNIERHRERSRINRKNAYDKNPEKFREYGRIRRSNNIDYYLQKSKEYSQKIKGTETKYLYDKKYRENHKEELKVKKRDYQKIGIINLSDKYISNLLKAKKIPIENIENKIELNELIDIQRIVIKTQRLCKQMKNCEML